MKILALDVGTRKTGVAFLDDGTGIPLPLDTLMHHTENELLALLMTVIAERKIDHVIVGLPLLPSGEPGSQATVSASVAHHLKNRGISVELKDERHTTPKGKPGKHQPPPSAYDGNSAAALALLSSLPRY